MKEDRTRRRRGREGFRQKEERRIREGREERRDAGKREEEIRGI